MIGNRIRNATWALALAWALATPALAQTPATFATAIVSGGKAGLSLATSFSAAGADQGRKLRVYMVAVVPRAGGEEVYARTGGQWQRVDWRTVPTLLATVGSTASQPLSVVAGMDVRDIVGTRVYLGYGREGGAMDAFDEMLGAGRYRLIHTTSAAWNDRGASGPGALTAVDAAGLDEHFRAALGPAGKAYLDGLSGGSSSSGSIIGASGTSTAPAPVAAPVTTSTPAVSSTTLQEVGVDEADLIKSDGVVVYSLDQGDYSWSPRTRISSRRLNADAADAAMTPLATLTLPLSTGASGLLLDAEHGVLVAVASNQNGSFYSQWFQPWSWTNGVTELALIDAAAGQMQLKRSLRINAALIGSRRVGATLYLVLRNYPPIRQLDPWLQETLVEKLSATDFMPKIAVDGGHQQPLVEADSCLIQKGNAALSADIISIVAIDLAASSHRLAARCFSGGTEAFYMSPSSLYLATTRYSYTYSGGYPSYVNDISTDLHKFSLDGLNILYRGSGSVAGHLGYDQQRKSFRMGEHRDRLRVITNGGTSFGGWVSPVVAAGTTGSTDPAAKPIESPAYLSVLEEHGGVLHLVGKLPNAARPTPLGKPGENLYATRFIGDRGYLVTYRLTDPLYVLDLSLPNDPKIAGQLEVSGYSDYLFPLSETLLLGVGKDAISDGASGDGRFAWYQGVKLSLIDVTDPAQPSEAARAVIGRRGTDATVLHDHHGIALQTQGGKVRVALPVAVNETPYPYATSTTTASTWYSFTRAELAKFEIDLTAKTLSARPALPSNRGTASYSFGYVDIRNDRALLWGEQTQYFIGDKWLSAPW